MGQKLRTTPIDKERDDDVKWILKLFVLKLLHPERFYTWPKKHSTSNLLK